MDDTKKQPAPFFRPEVIEHQSHRHIGQVLIHQPSSYWLIGLAALLLIILALSFITLGTHTRKATSPGMLIPDQGVLRVFAPTQGRVLAVHVKEGDQVVAGDPLFVISDERVSMLGEFQTLIGDLLTQREELISQNKAQALNRLERQKELFELRLQAMQEEESQFKSEISVLEQRERLARNNLERVQELRARGHVSISELQKVESDLLLLTSQKQAVQRSQMGLERDRLTLLAQRREAEERFQQEIVDAERTHTLLQQEVAENKVRSQQLVTAPFDGIVTGLNIQIGQQVNLNYLMASLLPKDRNLQAHIYVPPHQVGFIEPNQKVMLRYASFPYQKFGMGKGKVINIAATPYSIHELQPHIVSLLQGHGAQGVDGIYYLVTVELDSQDIRIYGNDQKLMPGMLFEADILQDKRRIYEWILEPVYSITKKQL